MTTSYPNWAVHYSGLSTPGHIPLEDVVHDFAVKAGIPHSRLTFVGYWGINIRGFMLRDDVRWKEVIKNICSLYGISFVESDGGWKFRIGVADADFVIDRTIDSTDLVEMTDAAGIGADTSGGGGSGVTLLGTRLFENEIPSQLDVSYIQYTEVKDDDNNVIDHNYTVTMESVKRPNGVFIITNSKRRESLSVPIILDEKVVKTLATTALYRYVSAQNKLQVQLPPEDGDIEPGDVIAVSDGDFDHIGRVTDAEFKSDYTQLLTLQDYPEEQDVVIEGATITFRPPDPPSSPSSQYIHLDVPLLLFTDDLGGLGLVQYHVLTGIGQDAWPGGRLWRSATDTNYADVSETIGVYPVVGTAVEVLAAPATPWSTDYVNELQVQITAGDSSLLVTCTIDDIRIGLNTLAVGQPGRWEVLQFSTVVANSDGTITLSELHRGRRGTEVYSDLHEAGDRVVLLNTNFVKELDYPTGNLAATFYFKAVGFGQFLDDALAFTYQISGAAELPYAPVHLGAAAISDYILLTCHARTRLDGRWMRTSAFPLGEASLALEWDIMDGSTVLRTLTSVVEEVIYSADDITTDFGSMPVTLTFRVYQISAVVDRGHRAEITVGL